MNLFYWMDICAVAVCAITATLEAGRKEMDLFGVLVVGLVSGVGGGTVRDLLLGRLPVFWVGDETYLVSALGTGTLAFFIARRMRLPANFFLVPDALGMALFTVIGCDIALQLGFSWLIAALMGVVTAVCGGIIRDVLCNEVPLIFRTEIYATASLAGALLMIALTRGGLSHTTASVIAMLAIVAVRLAAIRWRIQLPRIKTHAE
ncbi:MAG: trimeric intracellular cation channel family protein [Sulfuricella sp.]|nr:trimeric intracellular cation channel family protein [Sulfuricella sp.]